MTPYIILGILLGLPLALGLLFRVSASALFFSVMAGELLGRYFHSEAGEIARSFFKTNAAAEYAEAFIIVLPMFLTALFMHGSISRGKTLLHVIPLAITGIVLAAFVLPILPYEIQQQVATIPFGKQLLDTHNMIIGVVVLLQLISLWLLSRAPGEPHKKSHKK
ncbi:hypothetical protein KA047_02585 [Candidatus Saccharibacteria bacterium]|nr:hypothetical protein [Candidatus Saccharibacteria bacterium]